MTIQRTLITLFALFSVLGMWSADGDVREFSTTDGYTFRCFILSEEEKTIQLGAYELGAANAVVKKPSNSYNASLTIPEYFWLGGSKYTVKRIGSSAFQEEYWLSKVIIPETVTDIDGYAFYRCTNLQEVNIPKSVKSINNLTFYFTKLKSIVIPEGVDSIGRGAFMGTYIDSIAIPASVRYMFNTDKSVDGGNCFESIIGTNWIAVDDGNTVYDSRGNCNAIIETATNRLVKGCCNTIIPDGIKIIGKRAFDYAYYSQDRKNDYSWQNYGIGKYAVALPRSVVEIGEEAFYECNELGKIVIPGKVRKIGDRAFYGCSGMDSIVSYIREPFAIDSKNFCYWSNGKSKELSYSPTLYVPIGTSDKYRNTEGWNTIENIVEIELKEPETCATPTIAFEQGELVFSCETEGAQFVSEVRVADAKKNYDSRVALAPTYEISVYATREGYDDSDVATATITWRNGKPVMGGFSSITLEDGDPKGDVNEDGTVDVADIATIISIMAGK